jgi:hypothetical protein
MNGELSMHKEAEEERDEAVKGHQKVRKYTGPRDESSLRSVDEHAWTSLRLRIRSI